MSGEGEGPSAAPKKFAETKKSAAEKPAEPAELEGPPEPRKPAAPESAVTEVPPRPPAWQFYGKLAPRYLALADFAAVPRTKAGWLLRFVVTALALILLQRRVVLATRTLMTAKPPSPIPTEEIDDYRFRLPERTRREIFNDLAAAEASERARAIAANTWAGHLWSREDDRGHYERVAARSAAAKYKVSLSQVYLVLDEGIREQWPGPDGKPLSPVTPPLSIRSNSW